MWVVGRLTLGYGEDVSPLGREGVRGGVVV